MAMNAHHPSSQTSPLRRSALSLAISSLTSILIATSQPALAQSNAPDRDGEGADLPLEEVLVTATRREMKLMEVPQSIAALTNEFLESSGFDNLSEFAGQVPGLNFTERGPGRTSITIRGVSADPGTSSVSTVGIYIDDVAITNDDQNAQPDFKTFDVQRVEVLRGPQGTLYGEGAMGGVVRYITNKADPTKFDAAVDFSGASIEGGETGTALNAMLNIPVIENKLALRLVGLYRDQGGYIDNPVIGAEDFNSAEILGGGAIATWYASEDLTLEAMAITNRIDVDGDNITRGGDKDEFVAPALNPREDDYDLYSFTLNWSLPGARLTSVTGFSRRESSAITVDSDAALFGFVIPAASIFSDVVPQSSIFVFEEENENFTQEIRLVSTTDDPLQWTAGLWYRDGDFENISVRTTEPVLTFGGTGDYSAFGIPLVLGPNPLGGTPGEPIPDGFSRDPQTAGFENTAVFGEVSYQLTEQLQILLGARWFEETRTALAPLGTGGLNQTFQTLNTVFGIPNEGTDDEFEIDTITPKATLSYQPNDETLWYMSYATGVRSGGRNNTVGEVRGNECEQYYDEDTTNNFELGGKFQFAGGKVNLEASAFHIDWQDLQVLFFDPVTFSSCVDNAGSATSRGFEATLTALLADGLTVSIGGNYIEAELDESIPGADAPGAVISSGTQLPNVPEYKIGASVQYEWPLFAQWNGYFNANISAVGDSRAALEPGLRGDLQQPSYEITNARIGIQNARYGAYLFVTNLMDEYAVLADDTFGGIHRNQPRTIGLNLRAEL